MTILLAEDSPVYRHLITGHLNEWSFDRMCKRRSCCLGLADETRRAEVGSARLGTSWAG